MNERQTQPWVLINEDWLIVLEEDEHGRESMPVFFSKEDALEAAAEMCLASGSHPAVAQVSVRFI